MTTFFQIRGAVASIIAKNYDPLCAKRSLRSVDQRITARHGDHTLAELAMVMSDLLDFEHPLVPSFGELHAEAS
jgi:hypothetical protein